MTSESYENSGITETPQTSELDFKVIFRLSSSDPDSKEWNEAKQTVRQLSTKQRNILGNVSYGAVQWYLKYCDFIIIMFQNKYPVGFSLLYIEEMYNEDKDKKSEMNMDVDNNSNEVYGAYGVNTFNNSNMYNSFHPSKNPLIWDLLILVSERGLGSRFTRFIQNLAIRFHVSFIQLFALPNVINFYRRLGFQNARPPQCTESKDIHQVALQVDYMRFRDSLEAIQDPGFFVFLNLLIDHHLTKNPRCQDVWSCQEEGFVMTWCNPNTYEAIDEQI